MNDNIIEFYLKYIEHRVVLKESVDQFYFFNTFFFKTFSKGGYDKVKKWTRNVDIFSKKYILIPINDKLHWSLAIICNPLSAPKQKNNSKECQSNEKVRKENTSTLIEDTEDIQVSSTQFKYNDEENKINNEIEQELEKQVNGKEEEEEEGYVLFFDSFRTNNSNVYKKLRLYLTNEWENKKKKEEGERVFDKTTLPGHMAKAPLQNNHCDCGLFLLHYAEKFCLNPMKHADITVIIVIINEKITFCKRNNGFRLKI